MAAIETPGAPKKRFKSLGVRALTGFGLMFLCGFPVYFGGWLFTILVALFGARISYEWVRMTDANFTRLAVFIPIICLFASLVLGQMGEWPMAMIVVIVAAILTAVEKIGRTKGHWAALGCLYTLLPCLAIVWIRGDVAGIYSAGFAKIVFIALIVIAADSWAYIGGSMMKGPKLAPKISPNKTWSGFMTGLVFGAITGALCAYFTRFSILTGVILAIPVVLFSVVGDLIESAVKRRLNVKDAGDLLPGHGGLLDRVDSLMLAVLVSAFALMFWPDIWPVINAR
ncbi:MAG: CDP-archaeol synthase [Acidimicrobiales bacterium]|nr:CDP-archaeol synthase [Hyphomonadaceae bacterium]RZV43137.1 MAG: CDP-archaeol synthase [Acidimicrobiales bacterium]